MINMVIAKLGQLKDASDRGMTIVRACKLKYPHCFAVIFSTTAASHAATRMACCNEVRFACFLLLPACFFCSFSLPAEVIWGAYLYLGMKCEDPPTPLFYPLLAFLSLGLFVFFLGCQHGDAEPGRDPPSCGAADYLGCLADPPRPHQRLEQQQQPAQ